MKLRLSLLILSAVAIASAGPVGFLGIGSSGFVEASLTSLYWTPDASATGGGNGNANSTTDLVFAGCATGNLGDPGCLTLTEGIVINNDDPFVAGVTVLPVDTFFTFSDPPPPHAPLVFSLDAVMPGSANGNCAIANDAGESCSINGSPVVLTSLGGSVTLVSINLRGRASDTGVPGLDLSQNPSFWQGGFSATIPDKSPQQILLYFCPDGTCDTEYAEGKILQVNSVSGSFVAEVAPIPEPTTMALLGFGLITFGYLARKKANRKDV
jgi:hypothetical protein